MPPIAPPPHALHLEPNCLRGLARLDACDRAFLVANYGLETGVPRGVARIAEDLGRTRTEIGVGIGVAVRALHNDAHTRQAFFTYLCAYDATIPPEPTAPSGWELTLSTLGGRPTARERWVRDWIGRLPPLATLALAVVPFNPYAWMIERRAALVLETTL
jgi:hypothetical protein